MATMASQSNSLTVVYSTVYSDADQRKHQSSASLAFVRGIYRSRWIPRTKGQLRGKCFHLMTSSCIQVFPHILSNIFNLKYLFILNILHSFVIFHRRSLGNFSLDTVSPEYMFKKHSLTPCDLSPYVCNICWKFCIMMIMSSLYLKSPLACALTFVSGYH